MNRLPTIGYRMVFGHQDKIWFWHNYYIVCSFKSFPSQPFETYEIVHILTSMEEIWFNLSTIVFKSSIISVLLPKMVIFFSIFVGEHTILKTLVYILTYGGQPVCFLLSFVEFNLHQFPQNFNCKCKKQFKMKTNGQACTE